MDLNVLGLKPDQVPLLAALTDEELSYLAPRLEARSFEAGAVILSKGSPSDGLYVIASGLVGVNVSDHPGSEDDIASLGAGECVGEMSLVNGEPCSATIRALIATETWFIRRDGFPDILDRCPTLWRNLSGILSKRLVRTNRRLVEGAATRFTALYLLTEESTAAPLTLLLGSSVARQTRRRVLIADLRAGKRSENVPPPNANGSSHRGDLSTLRLAEAESHEGGGSLTLAFPDQGASTWVSPIDEANLVEELCDRFEEVLLICDLAATAANGPMTARAGSSVIVVDESRLREGAHLAGVLAGLGRHVDVAVLTDLAVTSDNKTGGLWEPAVNPRLRAISSQLVAGGAACEPRLLPHDPGFLSDVRARGLAAVDQDSEAPFLQSVSRLARRLGRVEVGIALGAGMAKGFAHLGVLKALRSHRVPIDYIAGASIGSIVGSTFAGGMVLPQLEGLMTGADRRFVRPTLPFRSVSSNRGLKKILTTCHERAPTAEFPELYIPFAALATDVTSGREVVLREGVVWSAVLASISMPGVFPAIIYEDRVLVDGGLTNPVPGKTVREMGADIVIGVDLASSGTDDGNSTEGPRVPNIIEMLWRTMEIMLGEITSRSAASADVTIRPNTGHSHIRDFSKRGSEFVAAGERAALAALPEIAALLPSLRSPEPEVAVL